MKAASNHAAATTRAQPQSDLRVQASGLPRRAPVTLIVPGLRDSSPAHWQSHWERKHPDYMRVVQNDWHSPDLDRWARSVDRHIRLTGGKVILVAHSFGCLASVRSAMFDSNAILGALLVAPADPDKFGVTGLLPHRALDFPSILAASRNDPWLKQETARELAEDWGSQFVDLGVMGHVNAESGIGAWPFGRILLGELAMLINDRRNDGETDHRAPDQSRRQCDIPELAHSRQ